MNKKIIGIIVALLLITIAVIVVINMNNKNKNEYEIIQVKAYNYYKFKDSEKFGVIDRSGKVIIEAKYDDIAIPNPEKDVFICYDDTKNIALNASGQTLFLQYNTIEPVQLKNIASMLKYEKSVVKYEKDGLYGLVDFNGKEITKNIYSTIENLPSTEGKFLVSKDGKYGVINLNGTVLVKTEYDEIKSDGYNGFITSVKTKDGYRYGYIDHDGTIILKDEFNSLIRIPKEEKAYLIVSKDGRFGFYEGSKKIINTEYQSMEYTDNGLLIIQKNKNYGIANFSGKILAETKYTNIIENGIYLYAEGTEENQVYDSNGNKVDINFSKVVYETDSEKYRITTLTNNDIVYYGIEDKNGNAVVSPSYSYIEYIYNDYFIARKDEGQLGIINANGKEVIGFKYDTLQKLKGKNILQAIAKNSNKTEIYSSELKITCEMENAKILNEDVYTKVFNDKEVIYLDNNGNKISEISEELKNKQSFPEIIGEYEKVQESLDSIYYVKK